MRAGTIVGRGRNIVIKWKSNITLNRTSKSNGNRIVIARVVCIVILSVIAVVSVSEQSRLIVSVLVT